jgi:hypothetical protein
MKRVQWLAVLGVIGLLSLTSAVQAQMRPYIGFVYPAGGQQGTTFQIKMGGQGMDDITGVIVTGKGVTGKIVDYQRKLGPQEVTLLREQLQELQAKVAPKGKALLANSSTKPAEMMSSSMDAGMNSGMDAGMAGGGSSAACKADDTQTLIGRIQRRVSEYILRPAATSIASLAYAEVTIAPNAEPGDRELRVITARGVSNPLVFNVGQLPESTRKPMATCPFQVLGKEELALRKRPPEEAEVRLTVPCTMNGQIASGETNSYRFEARKGQRLVISARARQLIPFIADAVPGWFQPVLTLYDGNGKEMAYDDDYRFKPDPVILFQVPKDGEYVCCITDAIFRGREDFVYRITIGETPFVTSIFPLGGRVAEPLTIATKGWNLQSTRLTVPGKDAKRGIHSIVARRDGVVSNSVPFAIDTFPETIEKEPNNNPSQAQKVTLPIIVNGRIDRPDDWDVYQFTGRAGASVVAEVYARRLESPLDSVIKVTDASGKVVATNDDYEDAGAGVNTHHADSYLMFKLPADGTYFVHVGDTARAGGEEYGYRLRISWPRPDFALRIVPSSVSIRGRGATSVTVYAIRKDGFAGPIKLGLKDPPPGFSSAATSMSGTQPVARLTIKSNVVSQEPVTLIVQGRAKVQDREIVRDAVPTEDRMQAFLWRHLVPAEELKVLAFDPSYEPPKRVPKPVQKSIADAVQATPAATASQAEKPKPKFTKQQVAGRLRQLKYLFEEGLLTDEFYAQRVAECEAAQ